jgi:hypothetical protein
VTHYTSSGRSSRRGPQIAIDMNTEAIIPRESNTERYDAVLRISEALCACCEPDTRSAPVAMVPSALEG